MKGEMGYHTCPSAWINHTGLGVTAGKLWPWDLVGKLHRAIIYGEKQVARQASWGKSLESSFKTRMPTKRWNEKQTMLSATQWD